MTLLETKGVTKRFGGLQAVGQMDFILDQGRIVSIIGPNGAGKTTFIKVLLSIVYPTSGSASMLGTEIADTAVKEKIGYLPENHKYPAYLTGEQVLRFFGKLSGLTSEALEPRITEMLTLVNMEKWRKVKIRKYSKGMMQRIGLAQALINQPDLVFLDEPTDGVDPLGRKQIRDLLLRLRDSGKTIFLNSHLLSEVELICDRVAILNKGKLLRLGTVDELTKQDQVFELDIEGELPEKLRIQWDAMRTSYSFNDGTILLNLPGLPELNAVIDQLRAEGVLLERVSQKKSSLEDMFIEVIGREEA